MRRKRSFLGWVAVTFMLGAGPALCITNGAPDGPSHPAIGFLLATNPGDICSGSHQLVSACSVTLIAPDLALTTGDCTSTFYDALGSGLIDQVWVVFDENPVAPAGSPYDCTKFIDVDETEIVTNPAFLASPATGANLGVLRLVSPLGITPVQLPPENRLKTLPRRAESLIAVATGATTRTTGDGYNIFDARRRSWPVQVNPPVKEDNQSFTLATGGLTAQACFGYSADGGAVFVGTTNEVVALTSGTLGSVCPVTASLPRLDVQSARDFLSGYVTLP